MPRKNKAAKSQGSTTWAFPCHFAFHLSLEDGPEDIPSCCKQDGLQTWTTAAQVKEHHKKQHSTHYFCQNCKHKFPTNGKVEVLRREQERHRQNGPCKEAPWPKHIMSKTQSDNWKKSQDPDLRTLYPEVTFTKQNAMLENWLKMNHAFGFPVIDNPYQFRRPRLQTSAVALTANVVEATSMAPLPSLRDDDVSFVNPYNPDLTPAQQSMQKQIHEGEGGPAGPYQPPDPQPLELGPNTVSDGTTVIADTYSEVDSGETWFCEATERWVLEGKEWHERLRRASVVAGLVSNLTRELASGEMKQ